jgi:Fe-S-cluster-containing hydrogenase component 2
MPTIRCLAMLYSLAGVDCIDVAADPAVIAAARGGIQDARRLVPRLGLTDWAPADGQPWLMASLNDSEDPHFRKAYFEAAQCPPDCSRPCETVCPTAAIQFPAPARGVVVTDLCYGCGRCLPVCPIGHIEARCHQADSQALAKGQPVDALEIHTHIGQQESFTRLWNRLAPFIPKLKVVSVSCPGGPGLETYLRDLYRMMAPLPVPLIWQTDGRPMSGDLGKGTTHAAIQLAQRVLQLGLPGYIQLAGGTNAYTVEKLMALNLVGPGAPLSLSSADAQGNMSPRAAIAGVAYGSYARQLVMPRLNAIEAEVQAYLALPAPGADAVSPRVGPDHSALVKGVTQARRLVGPLKQLPDQANFLTYC